jgi:hypothetical protein
MNNFEFVDESSFMTSGTFVNSGSNSQEVNPNNGYVTPVDSAVLTATNASIQYSVPVAPQGVMIGGACERFLTKHGRPLLPDFSYASPLRFLIDCVMRFGATQI